jgi:hypothetical protein
MSSSVLPENIEPVITVSEPLVGGGSGGGMLAAGKQDGVTQGL